MWRHPGHQRDPLEVSLADQRQVTHRQVPETAVDELGGGARGSVTEVAGVDQRYPLTRSSRIVSDPAADNASADHKQVEVIFRERLERLRAIHGANHDGAVSPNARGA